MFLKSKIKKGRSEEGFTLIETIITMCIAGILTAIAVLGYLSWKPGYEFRDAVSTVRGGLERAKMRAVETRKECMVKFNTDGFEIYDGNYVMNSGSWGSVDSDGEFTDSDPYSSVSLDDYPDISVQNEDGGTSSTQFIFSPHGFLDSEETINVAHSSEGNAEISVYVGGHVDITWL